MFIRHIVTLLALSLMTTSCENLVEVANAAPRVTWVAVGAPIDGVSEITVWVYDVEGDAVDIDLRWRAAGQTGEGTAIEQVPGGHGLVGLTTHLGTFEPQGQPHLILWDVSTVSGSVELRFVPKDQQDSGQVGVTPSFDITAGLVDAERLTPEL